MPTADPLPENHELVWWCTDSTCPRHRGVTATSVDALELVPADHAAWTGHAVVIQRRPKEDPHARV